MLDSTVSGRVVRGTHAEGIWVLTATIIGSSIAFIDATVVNVALPTIQNNLGADLVHMQWVVEAYGLFLASLILVGGALGDRWGRRRIFAVGIALFAIASLLCGTAANVFQLILARAIQGIGGAMLIPGSLSLITTSFQGKSRGRAIGTWSGSAAIMTALGPVLGGWLIEYATWRWVFYINIPLAIITLVILWTKVPESFGDAETGPLDWKGALLVTSGLGGVVFGLIESSNHGLLHPLVIGSFICGTACLIGFVWAEHLSTNPMVPLKIFQSKTFSGANIMTLLLYGALYGVLFFMPFNLIQLREYGELAAGAAFLPAIVCVALVSRWSGELMNRLGTRPLLVLGSLIAALGYGLFATLGAKDGHYVITLLPAMVALGLGMGICVAPLTTAVMSSVHYRYSGTASGLNNAVSYSAALLAIAVLGIIIVFAFNRELDVRLHELEAPTIVLEQLASERKQLAAAEVNPSIQHSITQDLVHDIELAIDLSFLRGFRLIMWIAAAMAIAAAAVAALTIEDDALMFAPEGNHIALL